MEKRGYIKIENIFTKSRYKYYIYNLEISLIREPREIAALERDTTITQTSTIEL